MNNILLIYWPIGPTFKDRVKSNLRTFDSYKFFDILILTDDVHYFDDIDSSNVKTLDLNYYRDIYPEFKEYEHIPEEKRDNGVYREQLSNLITQGKRFSINLQRYGLLYPEVYKYRFISILDCDMIPVHTEEDYKEFEYYLNNVMPENSMSTNRAYYTWNTERNLTTVHSYAKELNIHGTFSYPIEGCDALFKLYKFENSSKVREFFDVWNYILLDSFKKQNHLISGSWNILVEEILATVYKLLRIKVNTESIHYHGVRGIKSYNFPEDRFWEDWTHSGFDTNVNSQEEFIKRNYKKLEEYYKNQNLKFNY